MSLPYLFPFCVVAEQKGNEVADCWPSLTGRTKSPPRHCLWYSQFLCSKGTLISQPTARTDREPFGIMSGFGPRNSVLCEGDNPWTGTGNLRRNVPYEANAFNNCELDWSMQWHTTGADTWLQALDESIINHEVGCGIAHCSLITTIDLLFMLSILVFCRWTSCRKHSVMMKYALHCTDFRCTRLDLICHCISMMPFRYDVVEHLV